MKKTGNFSRIILISILIIYRNLTGVLLRLNADLKIELWTLDTFWWYLVKVKKALK